MKELSLHILDIIQNSIKANASFIQLEILECPSRNELNIRIEDNGCGMDEATLKKARSPFGTSRTTRKVGLGIPMFEQSAIATGGSFEITSQVGVGTVVTARYVLDSIDRAPMGDIAGTVHSLVMMNTSLDFRFLYQFETEKFLFDTREVREVLGDVPLNAPDVAAWIKENLYDGIQELFGGVER
ncbi:ATP-binding protein [Clostridia bacterium OttesenSCG-928-F22]|nr:ATP-binding protein [Clostridia bacterium OttesenSCG-928-F22]